MAEEKRTARPRPRARLVLAAIVVCATLLLVAAEALLWIIGAFDPYGLAAPNDVNLRSIRMSEGELYRPKAGVYPPEFLAGFRINSLGYRGPEYGPKQPGTYRVLAIGDSTVFGLFVEEEHAWPTIAQKILREDGHDVEILNMGRVATSTFGTRFDVEHIAESLQPDALIISVGWFNDFQIIHEKPEWDERRAVEADLFRAEWERAHSPLMLSRLYRLWRRIHWGRIAQENGAKTARWIAEGLYNPEAADAPRRVPLPQFQENLAAICSWAQQRGLPLYYTTPAMRPEDAAVFALQVEYLRVIQEEARRCGAGIIDTRALLLERAELLPIGETWLDNVHLTREANRAVAEKVAGALAQERPRGD